MDRHTADPYVRKAADEDLRSRSAFKLIEINDKFKFIHPGNFILDLGAAPGGWSLAASRLLRPQSGGLICAVDLLPLDPIAPHVHIVRGDFMDPETMRRVAELSGRRSPDVVLSGMLLLPHAPLLSWGPRG
jgi:23S rRNA (uridine2552-2'-O)-methyltransferase